MNGKRRFFFYLLLILVLRSPFVPAVPAQETETAPDDTGAPDDAGLPDAAGVPDDAPAVETAAAEGEVAVPDPEAARIALDIKTASFSELASWCRSLGLSDGGNKEELARRLRDHYKISEPGSEETPGRKTIIIESARSTEYFTLEAVDEEYARLRGDVIISLKDGNSVHRIRAWEILYNRTRNIMTASGAVEYVREEGDSIETFKGETITVNLDNWSSIFLDGISERSMRNDATAYRFAGTVISRSDESVTVLSRAEISNANNPDALWSLTASKLWLLPGSDFAVFNAILKVGEIPVLYIPFFHFPSDEVIFHPVLGIRSREGSFVQTTTYLLGRPKASSVEESSITKILGSGSDMEKRRDGIFLRSTGKKVQDTSEPTLSVLLDLYANLGTYAGTELTLPKKGLFGETKMSMGMGFSRTVTKAAEGFYTPFAPDYDGASDWNNSRLISWDVPFRYRLTASSSISGKYGSLSWSLPYYSDPYVDFDFMNRSEQMDWMHIIQEGAAIEEEATEENELPNYEWTLSGSITPQIPGLAPYISSLSITGLSSTISFRTRESNPAPSLAADPGRKFFFPDKFTIYSVNAAVAGTPFTLTGAGINTQGSAAAGTEQKQEESADPRLPGSPRPPWPADGGGGTGGTAAPPDTLAPPVLSQRFELPRSGGPRFAVDYRLSPSSATELQFRSAELGTRTNWKEAKDINWSEVSSMLSIFRGDASTGFTLDHSGGGAYTNTVRFTGTGSWQGYSFLNEEAEEYTDNSGNPDDAKIDAAWARAYNATYFTTSYEYSSQIRPFYQSEVWGNTNLQYGARGLIAKSVFTGTGDNPEWDVQHGGWNKEDLERHQFSTNLAASVMDKAQTFSLTADLPPEDTVLTGNATVRVWISETNANMKILDPGDEEKQRFDFLYATETLHFGSLGSLQQYMIFDPEKKEFNTLTTTLSLSGLSAAYTVVRMVPYRLNYTGLSGYDPTLSMGWIQDGVEQLCPRDFSLAYTKSFAQKKFWNDRLSFALNLNTSLNFDLQRYTYSRFRFALGFTLGISNFIDISFSTTSENAVIYRYFKDILDLPFELPEGDQNNLFLDFFNSFRFDDDQKRRESGFKLKSFTLSAVHHLGDWNAKLDISLSPYLDQTRFPYQYKFNNAFSFIVQWVPISEIKTDASFNKDTWVFR